MDGSEPQANEGFMEGGDESQDAAASNASHVQVKFFTKQAKYAVSESPFSLPDGLDSAKLSGLINGLLKEKGEKADEEEAKEETSVEFDFLLNGELIRVPLNQLVAEKGLSTESAIELEYVEKFPSPKPEDSLAHDDWVAAIQGKGSFILSGCYDHTVNVWTVSGEKLLTIPGHSGPVKSVAWIQSQDQGISSFISGSHDQTLILWSLDLAKLSVERMHVCRGHAGSVDAVAVSPDGNRILSGSWDKSLKIWSAGLEPEPGTGEESSSEKKAKRLKENDDEASSSDSRLHTRTPLLTLAAHNEGVSSLAWMEGPKVASASWDHAIKLWDVETAKEERVIQGNKVFLSISNSPLNGLLASGSCDRHVRVYDPRSREGAVVKSSLTHHTGWVSGVSWSPTNANHLFSGAYDGVAKLWDLRSVDAPLFNMSGHEDKILGVDWSIPEKMLTGGADNSLKIFRTRT